MYSFIFSLPSSSSLPLRFRSLAYGQRKLHIGGWLPRSTLHSPPQLQRGEGGDRRFTRGRAWKASEVNENGASKPASSNGAAAPPTSLPTNTATSSAIANASVTKGAGILKAESDSTDAFANYAGEVFCNRNLNMQKINAIGFDMDYTLSEYIPETFETLAYEGAVQKLVNFLGYPHELLEIRYDHTRFVRGLVIDKVRGNVIKMDRHKYVKIAYHGRQELSEKERKTVYDPNSTTWDRFGEPNYAVLDTLFSLPDAFLFSAIVDFKDANPGRIQRSYEEIYKDVRKSVDLCHRDGVIKDKVAQEPGLYIHKDPHLRETLDHLRRSGKKLFLLTNSLYDYTQIVMTHVCGEGWIDIFDVIVVGACKPAFLTDTNLPIYRVKEDGSLVNTEGPMFGKVNEYLHNGKTFQGGNWRHLHDLLQVPSGSRILYVGDHMYSDILRSKRQLGWRTMLIIPELEREINVLLRESTLMRRVEELRGLRDELHEWVDRLNVLMRDEEEMETAWTELRKVKDTLRKETREYHLKYHPTWGQLFKTGYQNSRFALQVENYACLYTSRVSNMRHFSAEMNFRCMSDVMPHDRLEDNPIRRLLRRRQDQEDDDNQSRQD